MGIINVTNKLGVAGITAFTVSDTGYDCTTDTPTTDFNTTLYHSGAGTYPVPGDTIYKNSVGSILFTSSDEPLDRNIQIQLNHLRVNSNGIMIITC